MNENEPKTPTAEEPAKKSRKKKEVSAYHSTDLSRAFERLHHKKLKKFEKPNGGYYWKAYDDDPNSSSFGLWVDVSTKHPQDLLEKLGEDLRAGRKILVTGEGAVLTSNPPTAVSPADWEFFQVQLDVTKVKSILSATGSLGLMMAKESDFDQSIEIRGVRNGVLDFSNGWPALRPNSPDFMLTKRLNAVYDESATWPEWDEFLDQVTRDADGNPDPELREWIQRLFGYTLSGTVKETIIPLYLGRGCNGKSTLMTVISELFDELAGLTDPRELAASARDYNANNESKADLMGKLMVWCDELPENGSWDPSKFKLLTGGKIRAQRKHKSAVVFRSTCVIHLAGQHLPTVRDLSDGFWRRIRVVPFRQNFEEVRDEDLPIRLTSPGALSAVLNWVIEGWMLWNQAGLGMCEAVSEATRRYREDESGATPRAFLEECCEVHDPKDKSRTYLTEQSVLYPAFYKWATDSGVDTRPWDKKKFVTFLREECGFTYARVRREDNSGNSAMHWHGIRLHHEYLLAASNRQGGSSYSTRPSPVIRQAMPEQKAPEPIPDEVLELMREQQMEAMYAMEEAEQAEKQAEKKT